jgi:hypothetical protein
MAGPAYVDAFRRIVVQPDNIIIAADAVDDTLTLVAGAGISLVASASSDQITIVNTNTSSPSTELFAKSLTVDGIIIDTNVIRGTDSNADLEIYASGTGAVSVIGDLKVSGVLASSSTKIAIGALAGVTNQGVNGLAIGPLAGQTNQGIQSVAVGNGSGNSDQGLQSVAVGNLAGSLNQGQRAVAIGSLAGSLNQGEYAVALGNFAGGTNQPANSIMINASGLVLNGANAGLYIDPIRNTNGGTVLNYNTTTKEISYTHDLTVGSININTNVVQTIDSNADLDLRASGTGAVQLRSNLKLIDGTSPDGAWSSYSPTWTASVTNPVLNNGTIDGRYKQVGKTVHFYINILMGSTTTFGAGDWRVSLPITAQNAFNVIANAMYLDNTVQWYEGSAFNSFTGSTTTLTMYYTNTTVSNIAPFTWASGDYLIITGTYEAS